MFVAYKCDIKKTWQVISETLNRNKKKHEMLSLFTHEGRDLAGSTEFANAFNTYFTNIGKNLSSQIYQNIDDADYNNISPLIQLKICDLNVSPKIIQSR